MTNIIVTIGTTMSEQEKIKQLIGDGVYFYRINMGLKHRNLYDDFSNLREWDKTNKIKVLLDLPSTRCRFSKKHGSIKIGNRYCVYDDTDYLDSIQNCIALYGLKKIMKEVEVDEKIIFKDGKVIFLVESIADNYLNVRCLKADAELNEMNSCIFGGKSKSYEIITESEISLLKRYKENYLVPDFLAISFVRTGEEIFNIKKILNDIWGENSIKILSKIENYEAYRNINSVINYVDGVIFERGDFFYSVKESELPRLQKQIIKQINQSNKISIVTTGFLGECAETGNVSRAELSDVFLAIEEKVDYIMLACETGHSRFPQKVVQLILEILREGSEIYE